MIIDKFGRTFETLRISLTNKCNLGCIYCVSADSSHDTSPIAQPLLSKSQLIEVTKSLQKRVNLKTIRLTGGEPLLYQELPALISDLKELNLTVKITTNGYLLDRKIQLLKDAGLDALNISLDAINPSVFEKIANRKHINSILNGIDKALELGMDVKINSVILKGLNDAEILPLFHYCKSRNISIRYLELMKMGHLFSNHFSDYFYSQADILSEITSEFTFTRDAKVKNSTAQYWTTSDDFKFGIIANESEPFCGDCNRLRLDSEGNIYGCLSSNTPLNVLSSHSDPLLLDEILKKALSFKQPVKFKGSEVSMLHIGG